MKLSRFAFALSALLALLAFSVPSFAQVIGAPNSTATLLSTQTADHVAFTGGTDTGVVKTGGTIDGTVIGGATPAAGSFTALTQTGNTPMALGTFCTAAGATPQTCNGLRGIVTTGTLTTAANTASTYVINDSSITSSSLIACVLQAYSGTYVTNGLPEVMDCKAGSGTLTVDFANTNGTNALNGTLKFGFVVLN